MVYLVMLIWAWPHDLDKDVQDIPKIKFACLQHSTVRA